jgi:hypothetical protein
VDPVGKREVYKMRDKGIMLMIGADGKAKIYDDTYDVTVHCESAKEMEKVKRILNGDRWIPAGHPPETDDYILLSFANLSVPEIGRYEKSEDGGGSYYIADDEIPCIEMNVIVNAWMPLPKPYK